VEKYCPTRAFSYLRGEIDRSRCFDCCTCVYLCPDDAFIGNCGSLEIDDKILPITLRQSNRKKANLLAEKLKRLIEEKEFFLTKPSDCLR